MYEYLLCLFWNYYYTFVSVFSIIMYSKESKHKIRSVWLIYSLSPNKKCCFYFVVSNKIRTFAAKSKYMEKELFRAVSSETSHDNQLRWWRGDCAWWTQDRNKTSMEMGGEWWMLSGECWVLNGLYSTMKRWRIDTWLYGN